MKYHYAKGGKVESREQAPTKNELHDSNGGGLKIYRAVEKHVEVLIDGCWRVASQAELSAELLEALGLAPAEKPVEAVQEPVEAETVSDSCEPVEAAGGVPEPPVEAAGTWEEEVYNPQVRDPGETC